MCVWSQPRTHMQNVDRSTKDLYCHQMLRTMCLYRMARSFVVARINATTKLDQSGSNLHQTCFRTYNKTYIPIYKKIVKSNSNWVKKPMGFSWELIYRIACAGFDVISIIIHQ